MSHFETRDRRPGSPSMAGATFAGVSVAGADAPRAVDLDAELALLADLDGGDVPVGLEGRLMAALARQEAERAAGVGHDPWGSLSRAARRGLAAYWLLALVASALLLVAARGVVVPSAGVVLLATVCALAAIPLAALLPLLATALAARGAGGAAGRAP